jgi:tetratricopeptide (TPR) repeat protein
MKRKTAAVIFVLLASFHIKAQYQEEMKKTIDLLNQVEKAEELKNAANRFERISMIDSAEWLPYYYVAYSYARMSYYPKNDRERDLLADKALSEYEKAKSRKNADKDELLILYAYILEAKFSIAYLQRLKLNTEAIHTLQDVIKKYPSNPRAYLLYGIAKHKMPSIAGGDKKEACRLFEKAHEIFSIFKPKSEIHPDWGKESIKIWLDQCSKN